MNERYDKLNQKIKEWNKSGKQDEFLLKSLFAQVNLENAPKVNPNKDFNSTTYNDLSNEKLYMMYESQFNNLSTKELQNLIQETHNRFINSHNLDVTRQVVVDSDKEQDGVYGYVSGDTNMLFINKYVIDKAKQCSVHRDNFNAENVGKCVLFTVVHESQHVVQFDNSIKFALHEEQTKEEKFSGAITNITNANFFVADKKNDETYFNQWQAMYDYHFLEHEANYTATKNLENMIDDDYKNGMSYHQYVAETSLLGLRYMPSLTESNNGKIKTRVQKIENYIKKQVAYFDENIKNCPMKSEILKTVNEYMKVDEKGNSELRKRLFKEINEMDNNCVNSIKAVKEMRKSKNKKSINDYSYNDDFSFNNL